MDKTEIVSFKEIQQFRQIWILLAVFFIAVFMWYTYVRQIIFNQPFGNNPMPNTLLVVFMLMFGFVYSPSVLQAGDLVKDASKGMLKMTAHSSDQVKQLSGVEVTARMGSSTLSTLTDKNGYAQISLPEGTWKITLTLKGWQAQSGSVRIESGHFTAYKIKLYPTGAKPGGARWIPSTGGLVPGRL